MNKCIKCGSYAFNLYKEDIDQGGLCDVHYWQGRAHRAEALAQSEQEPMAVTAEMARAFHRAISDGPLGQADEFEIQTGLEAAFANITTPPQRKPWVSLSDEDIERIAKKARSKDHAITLAQREFKEKNT